MNLYIADAHNDFLTNNNVSMNYIDKLMKKNNITLCNAILFSKSYEFQNFDNAINLRMQTNKYANLKKICIYSFENLQFLNEKNIDKYLEFSPFSSSLTWNYDNQFAGGAMQFGSLKQVGIELIKLLNKNNIIIDTAHLNRKSFWQVLKYNKLPILNSHTCLNLFEHRRNIDIEQAKAIIDTNGFIGITFVNEFLTPQTATSQNVFENIDAIIQKFGIKNIGIGSDYYGTTQLPVDLQDYSDFSNLFKRFRENGYTTTDIDKIFYKNFENFVKSNTIN